MLLDLRARSCSINLKTARTKSDFNALLNSLAREIWKECIYDAFVPEHFACDDIPSDEKEGVAFIANGLQNYIADFDCCDEGTSFIVYSEYDVQDYGDSDLANRIAEFFFLKSNLLYCLSQNVQFNHDRGCAEQWITFKNSHQIKTMRIDLFVEFLFKHKGNSLPLVEELATAV
jgi:hypothetical protein